MFDCIFDLDLILEIKTDFLNFVRKRWPDIFFHFRRRVATESSRVL